MSLLGLHDLHAALHMPGTNLSQLRNVHMRLARESLEQLPASIC